jgi:hypothetical protein
MIVTKINRYQNGSQIFTNLLFEGLEEHDFETENCLNLQTFVGSFLS